MHNTPKTTQLEMLDDNGNSAAHIMVGSDIIDYIEPARTFGRDDLCDPTAKGRHQRRMIAVPDRRSNNIEPMVLVLGKQQRLSLVRRSGESSAGWETFELLRNVQAFGTAWAEVDGQERLTLAVAVDTGNGVSRLLIAYDVDAVNVDWQALPWTDFGSRETLNIDGIRVLRGADNVWNVLLSAGLADKQNAYLVRSDRGHSLANDSIVFSTATALSEIFDFGLGVVNGNSALHVIGAGLNGTGLALQARLLPTAHKGESSTPVYPYVCPQGARSMALGYPRKRGNDLYVAGSGVTRIPADQLILSRTARSERVIEPEQAKDIRQISVCENKAGNVSVWALQGDGTLLLTHRENADQPWSPPLSLRSGIVDLAPVEGDEHITTGVLVVYQDGHAGHLRRDNEGIWQETEIRVADPEESASITCFSTNVTITDGAGIPLADANLKLRASVLSTLVINGCSTVVGPEPVDVKTDLQGMLRIFNRAMSFTPAAYEIKINDLPTLVEINPAVPLYGRFEQMSASELQKAELAGGKGYLLPQQYRTKEASKTIEALLSAIRQASLLAAGSGSDGVQLRAAGTTFSSSKVVQQLDEGHSWGVSSTGKGELTTLAPAQAAALTCAAVAVALPGQSLSDLLEALWVSTTSAFDTAVTFVLRKVSGVVEFVCEVAGKVKRFVLDTLEKIGGFFKWLWQTVGTAIDKVWNYAKYLFAWKDITAMRNTMAMLVDEELTLLVTRVSDLKNKVGSAFDSAISAIQKQCEDLDIRPRDTGLRKPGSGTFAATQKKPENRELNVTASGPGGGVMDLVGNIMDLFVKIEMPPASREFTSLSDTLDAQIEVFSNLGGNIKSDFQYIFKDGFSLAELDLDKLKRIILSLILNVAEAVTTAARNIVLQLIESIAALVDMIRQVLFATISFPFIEKTIGLLSGETTKVSVRLIDILLFMPSILGTVACKLFLDDQSIKAALDSRLPNSGGLAAQSSQAKSTFGFITDVMSTYVAMGMLLFDMLPALAGPRAQKATEKLHVAGWGCGVLLLMWKNPWRSTRTVTPQAQQCAESAFWVGLMGVSFGLWKLRRGWSKYLPSDPGIALDKSSIYPPVEIALLSVQSGIRIAQYICDDKDRGTSLGETFQFVARNGAKSALKWCLIHEEPITRTKITGAAIAGGFVCDYMFGMVRHGLSRPN